MKNIFGYPSFTDLLFRVLKIYFGFAKKAGDSYVASSVSVLFIYVT